MSIFSRFLPKKKKPGPIPNNVPKEKKNIRKTFEVYCHAHHGTSGKLCPKCTALLATAMTHIDRCPYGITKPICDRCDRPCFGAAATRDFRHIMGTTQKRMLLRHPMQAVKHKLASMGVDYAQDEKGRREQKKAEAREKAAKARAKKEHK